MKEFEDKLEEKFGSLTTTINHHTDQRHETTTTTITNHTTNLHVLLGTIAQEFQQSNLRMQGIIQGLSTATPDIKHRTAPPPTPQGPHMTALPLPIQPPRTSKTTLKCTIKDPTPLMDSAHIDYPKCTTYFICFVLLCIYLICFELLLLYNKKYALLFYYHGCFYTLCAISSYLHNQYTATTLTQLYTPSEHTHTNPPHMNQQNTIKESTSYPKSKNYLTQHNHLRRSTTTTLILLLGLSYLPANQQTTYIDYTTNLAPQSDHTTKVIPFPHHIYTHPNHTTHPKNLTQKMPKLHHNVRTQVSLPIENTHNNPRIHKHHHNQKQQSYQHIKHQASATKHKMCTYAIPKYIHNILNIYATYIHSPNKILSLLNIFTTLPPPPTYTPPD